MAEDKNKQKYKIDPKTFVRPMTCYENVRSTSDPKKSLDLFIRHIFASMRLSHFFAKDSMEEIVKEEDTKKNPQKLYLKDSGVATLGNIILYKAKDKKPIEPILPLSDDTPSEEGNEPEDTDNPPLGYTKEKVDEEDDEKFEAVKSEVTTPIIFDDTIYVRVKDATDSEDNESIDAQSDDDDPEEPSDTEEEEKKDTFERPTGEKIPVIRHSEDEKGKHLWVGSGLPKKETELNLCGKEISLYTGNDGVRCATFREDGSLFLKRVDDDVVIDDAVEIPDYENDLEYKDSIESDDEQIMKPEDGLMPNPDDGMMPNPDEEEKKDDESLMFGAYGNASIGKRLFVGKDIDSIIDAIESAEGEDAQELFFDEDTALFVEGNTEMKGDLDVDGNTKTKSLIIGEEITTEEDEEEEEPLPPSYTDNTFYNYGRMYSYGYATFYDGCSVSGNSVFYGDVVFEGNVTIPNFNPVFNELSVGNSEDSKKYLFNVYCGAKFHGDIDFGMNDISCGAVSCGEIHGSDIYCSDISCGDIFPNRIRLYVESSGLGDNFIAARNIYLTGEYIDNLEKLLKNLTSRIEALEAKLK